MRREDYERYLSLFNSRDYDGLLRYFADRFEVRFGGVVLHTPEELRRFYAFLHARVGERIVIDRYVSDERTIAMEARVQLTCVRDLTAEDLAAAGYQGLVTMRAGERVEIPQFIHYHLENGRFVKALCALA